MSIENSKESSKDVDNSKESSKDVFDHQEIKTLLMFFDFSKIDDTSPTAYIEVEQKLFAQELACASNSSDLNQDRRQEEEEEEREQERLRREEEEERQQERLRREDNPLNMFEPGNYFENQDMANPEYDRMLLSVLEGHFAVDNYIMSNCDIYVRNLLRRRVEAHRNRISSSPPSDQNSSDDDDGSLHVPRIPILPPSHVLNDRISSPPLDLNLSDDDDHVSIRARSLRRRTVNRLESNSTFSYATENSYNNDSSNYDPIRTREVHRPLRRSNIYTSDSNTIFSPAAESFHNDDDSSNLLRNRLLQHDHMPVPRLLPRYHMAINDHMFQSCLRRPSIEAEFMRDSDRTSSPPLEQNSHNEDNSSNFDPFLYLPNRLQRRTEFIPVSDLTSSPPLEQNSPDNYYIRVRNLLMSYPWGNDISPVSEEEREKEEVRDLSISLSKIYSDSLLQLINPLIVELNSYNEIDDGSKEEDNNLSDRVLDQPSIFTNNGYHLKCALTHFIFNLRVAGGREEDVVTLLTELRKRFTDGPCFEQINSLLLKFIHNNTGNDSEEDDREEEQNQPFKIYTFPLDDANEGGNMENTKVGENGPSKKLSQWI